MLRQNRATVELHRLMLRPSRITADIPYGFGGANVTLPVRVKTLQQTLRLRAQLLSAALLQHYAKTV